MTQVTRSCLILCMAQLPTLLTTAEVAAAWGVSEATVRRWAADNQIDHQRTPSGGLRFPSSALPKTTAAASP